MKLINKLINVIKNSSNRHDIVGCFVVIATFILYVLCNNIIVWLLYCNILVAIAFEVKDVQRGNKFDVIDFIKTVLPAVVTIVLMIVIHLSHSINNPCLISKM